MVLKEAIEILEENGYIVEGRFTKALATGALAAGLAFGSAHAHEQPAQPVKEISSVVLPMDIQKDYNIKNVTLDNKKIDLLAKQIKTQIKADWEAFGYDNRNITETKGWKQAVVIRDTLETASPWLYSLFRTLINRELHDQLSITPRL